MTKKQEFINTLINLKNKNLMGGFDPNAVYVQACLETGHINEKDLLVQHYNLFGIKAHKNWLGEKVSKVKTMEIINGAKVEIVDEFIAFNDFYRMMTYYFVKINSMYPNAYEKRGDYKGFFKGLMNGVNQWSTATGIDKEGKKTEESYDEALTRIYERMKKEGFPIV